MADGFDDAVTNMHGNWPGPKEAASLKKGGGADKPLRA
jgi:hypothetical protein